MLKPTRTIDPSTGPVTLAEAIAHCRAPEDGSDDTYITSLIAAATAYLDGWSGILGRALVNQSWTQGVDAFASPLRLPLAPVQSITSVTYYDADNASQTLASSVYTLLDDELGPFVTLQADQSWPGTFSREDAVTVTYVAGYGAAGSDVPASIRHAIKLLVGNFYENREAVVIGQTPVELPMAVHALLSPYRRIGF